MDPKAAITAPLTKPAAASPDRQPTLGDALWLSSTHTAAAPLGLAATGLAWLIGYVVLAATEAGGVLVHAWAVPLAAFIALVASGPALRYLVERIERRRTAIWLGAAWHFLLTAAALTATLTMFVVFDQPAHYFRRAIVFERVLFDLSSYTLVSFGVALASAPILSVGGALTAAWLHRGLVSSRDPRRLE